VTPEAVEGSEAPEAQMKKDLIDREEHRAFSPQAAVAEGILLTVQAEAEVQARRVVSL
jgi:hypothetical protein